MERFKKFADVLATNGGSIITLSLLFLICFASYCLLKDAVVKDFAFMILGALLAVFRGEIKHFTSNTDKFIENMNATNSTNSEEIK